MKVKQSKMCPGVMTTVPNEDVGKKKQTNLKIMVRCHS